MLPWRLCSRLCNYKVQVRDTRNVQIVVVRKEDQAKSRNCRVKTPLIEGFFKV